MFNDPTLNHLFGIEFKDSRVNLEGQRMVMLNTCALGSLCKELVDTFGRDVARGLFIRMGYSAGFAEGHALMERHPEMDANAHMRLGTLFHAFQGGSEVVRIDAHSEVDLEKGVYEVEGVWQDSFEVDLHKALFKDIDYSCCWFHLGYASGHSSAVAGKQVYAVETHCRGKGDDECRFVVGFDDSILARFPLAYKDFQRFELPSFLAHLQQKIDEQDQRLREKKQFINHLQKEQSNEHFGRICGVSPAIRNAIKVSKTVANVDSLVLITGESGTGKELFARGIHDSSARAKEEFVAINCATLTETLQESELFGYKKGAFTGANRDRQGLFETACDGTLFLDEIGELSLATQAKLLRVLQEGTIRRVGDTEDIKVDVRIIAATHRNLESMVESGEFRQDLYFRLSVITIELPPLRERDNDVHIMADGFVKEYAAKFSKTVHGITPRAQRMLAGYNWPGNIRELQNTIHRAVLFAECDLIDVDDLPQIRDKCENTWVDGDDESTDSLAVDHEREALIKAMQKHLGNRAKAAKELGISRTTLWRKLKQFDLLNS